MTARIYEIEPGVIDGDYTIEPPEEADAESEYARRFTTKAEARAWLDAYTALSNADRARSLEADDVELLAIAASMVGRMDELLVLLERAHDSFLAAGESLRAARCAFWLGLNLALRGEVGAAGGWFGRAERLVTGGLRERREGDVRATPPTMRGNASPRTHARHGPPREPRRHR